MDITVGGEFCYGCGLGEGTATARRLTRRNAEKGWRRRRWLGGLGLRIGGRLGQATSGLRLRADDWVELLQNLPPF
jgi:hypothetical protein